MHGQRSKCADLIEQLRINNKNRPLPLYPRKQFCCSGYKRQRPVLFLSICPFLYSLFRCFCCLRFLILLNLRQRGI